MCATCCHGNVWYTLEAETRNNGVTVMDSLSEIHVYKHPNQYLKKTTMYTTPICVLVPAEG